MSLNEGTFVGKNAVADALKDDEFKALKSDEKAKAIATLKKGGSITTEEDKDKFSSEYDDNPKLKGGQKKLPDALQKAIINRIKEMAKHPGYGKDPETGEFVPMSFDDAWKNMVDKIKQDYEDEDSLKEGLTEILLFLREEYNPPEYTIFEPKRGEKGRYRSAVGYKPLKSPTDTVGDLKKFGKKVAKVAGKKFDSGLASFLGVEYNKPFSDFVKDLENITKDNPDNTEIQKFAKKFVDIKNMSKSEFDAFIKELGKAGYSNDEIKRLKKKYNDAIKAKNKKAVKEENEIKLPADTTFTLDLKHLMQKHGKEKSIKLTKALMKKLHDKGKVEVDGTTLVFEMNMDTPKDTLLALPKAPAKDFLGDDGKDYEGGMAKSQMFKMKKYADALCNMVDDETQLEAWVQAKITKASDYMSAVYHYLDYQNSKMDEALNPSMMDTDEVLVSILMSVSRLDEDTAEQVVDNLTAEDFKKAAMMIVRDVDEREIARFVLSATKLDENSK